MALQTKGLLRVCKIFYSFRSKSHANKFKAFEFNRKTRFIGKLFAENAAERKQWSRGLPTHKVYGASSLSPKRLDILNRVFLSSITDGLTRSTRCNELAELGLLVSRAELSKCGQSVRVMWLSSSYENDPKIATILEECKGELQDNIITKTVGGYIPQIIFTKDSEATSARDIEAILSHPAVVKDLVTELPKSEDDKNKEEEENQFKVEISTCILGLKRADVLKRVMVNVKRLRRTERKQKEQENEVYDEADEEIPDRLANIDVRKQKTAIDAYIRKQMKADRQSINSMKDFRLKKELIENAHGAEDNEDNVEHEFEDVDEEEECYKYMKEESTIYQTDLESSEKQPTT